MKALTIAEAQDISGLSEREMLDLVARGVLRPRDDPSAPPILDADEFHAWRRPPLPERWRDLLDFPPQTGYLGLETCPTPVRQALERFLRDVQSISDPLLPVPSAPHGLRYVRYSASSGNDLFAIRTWLLSGPAGIRDLGNRLLEEDEWE